LPDLKPGFDVPSKPGSGLFFICYKSILKQAEHHRIHQCTPVRK